MICTVVWIKFQGHGTPSPTPAPEKKKKINKFAGLLKFWDGMQKIICGHERNPKKASDNKKGRRHDEGQGHAEGHGESQGHAEGHGEDSSTVRPEVTVSEDHHRSKRSPDSVTESLAQSFNFGKIWRFILYIVWH